MATICETHVGVEIWNVLLKNPLLPSAFVGVFTNVYYVVYFLLGDSPGSEVDMPTFRNTLFHLHTYSPMKMEQTECSETLAYKQTPANHPVETKEHSEQGESLKSRKINITLLIVVPSISLNR
jgi:hypothetical protein